MRRADRLFLLIQALRGRRAVTGRVLAERLQVSLRTVYRDVQDLQLSGVPIEGEAGVGYVLRKGADIPPLMFTPEELEALIVGARFVEAFASDAMSSHARTALLRIEGVLPETLKQDRQRPRVLVPRTPKYAEQRALMQRLHAAIAERRVVEVDYAREDGVESRRVLEPIALVFWGTAWTLGAWCRLRDDFRNFRIDRIRALDARVEHYADTPARSLAAYLKSVGAE